MALITANDLISFTPIAEIKARNSTLLGYDILEAETDVIDACGHDFSDTTLYPTIPDKVKLAALKLAQYYAIINSDENVIRRIKSQNLGDFSYTSDGIEKPVVIHLLRSYMNTETGTGNVSFRMSAL